MKRDTGMRSEDILALLSLWDAQQRHNKEASSSYYNPASYYSEINPYEDAVDTSDIDEKWMDEPVVPASQYANYYDNSMPSHYRYSQNYPEYVSEAESNYLQHLDALRRKRQWSGFNRTQYAKRFMVAKKRSDNNQYMLSQKFKPREDLYSLNELLKATQGGRDQGIPLVRRMIL